MPTKRPREEDDQSNHDEEEVDQVVESDADEPTAAPSRDAGKSKANHASTDPSKKRRGRPPGSKNKKTLAAEAAAAGVPAAPPPPKRPRGRPRKPRTEAELEAERQKALMPKRPRGRPPKKPRLDDGSHATVSNGAGPGPSSSAAAAAVAGPSTQKKSRGSPKKHE
ncbi:hypothetical protein FRC01_001395 [Tulasnella sp. 417]|nr:hypothetical protein FRC01_001395 [Tulasnella sp. 417]